MNPRRAPGWPILVAGGGIASLTFALALRQAAGDAVSIAIFDPGQRGTDGRAYALSAGAVRMLETLGLWGEVGGRAQAITSMRITDSRLEDVVRPDYLGFQEGAGPLGHMIEADDLSAALSSACRAAGIEFVSDTVVRFDSGPDGLAVQASGGPARRAMLLVAADGARSALREIAGIGWVGRRYRQTGIVATVAHEGDHGGGAVQHFLPSGPFALLPLAGPGRSLPHRSSIVWTENEERARAILALPSEQALDALAQRFGRELGGIALESTLVGHPLAIGMARRFVSDRLALLGDAAHQIHPLAGQGLNLGLADAAALAEHVAEAVRLGIDPGSPEVLSRYERARRFDAVLLGSVTDSLNRLFSTDSLPTRFIRDLGLGVVNRAATPKGLFARVASGQSARAPRLMRGEAI